MTSPFLSIITRCSKRPDALLRCALSVSKQTCLDVEQVFLVDHEHRGLIYANQQFHRYRDAPRGEYVWALDDDDVINKRTFIERLKETAAHTDADVIVVKTIHEHTGRIHPEPKVWDIEWESGERPGFWVGGGSCVVVKREVWKQHLETYYDGQGKEWDTGGDWHFITSLTKDKKLSFARCDIVAGHQMKRGYGQRIETDDQDWFDQVLEKLPLEKASDNVYHLDYREAELEWIEVPNVNLRRPLRILQLAQWDWAGCAYMLSEAIDRHTIHRCKCVRWKEDSSFGFPSDIVAPSREQFAQLWKWADVVHIHDSAPVPRGFKNKPTVITMHGSKYRKSPAKYQKIAARRGWLLTVATPDLTIIHGAPYMPDTRVGLPEPSRSRPSFTAIHCPSIRVNKGTKAVIEAMRKIPQIPFRLVEDVTWTQCLEIKGSLTRGVLIDQFEWGYGCNAIEAWMYGLPVISNATGAAKKAFEVLFGYFPFKRATHKHLDNAVLELLNPRVYDRVKDIGIGHLNRYHTPEAAARIALELYERVMNAEKSEDIADVDMSAEVGTNGMTLLRYLGHNYGRTTWYGPVTDQEYHFSAANRLRYVDDRDVPGLLAIERHTNPQFERAED